MIKNFISFFKRVRILFFYSNIKDVDYNISDFNSLNVIK